MYLLILSILYPLFITSIILNLIAEPQVLSTPTHRPMPHWYPQPETHPNDWATINNHLSGLGQNGTSDSKNEDGPRILTGKNSVKSGDRPSGTSSTSLNPSDTLTKYGQFQGNIKDTNEQPDKLFPLEQEESSTQKIIKVKVPKVCAWFLLQTPDCSGSFLCFKFSISLL